MENRVNPLLENSYGFALNIADSYHSLLDSYREYILSKQLLRSGTSVGVLSEEAQQPEWKADFIYKSSIANKEAHASHYWLRLIRDRKKFDVDATQLIAAFERLKTLIVAIIKSSRKYFQLYILNFQF